MIPYPTELPVDDLKELISAIRAGNVVSDRVRFAKAVWELQGYLFEKAFGELNEPVHIASALAVPHPETIIGHLELLIHNPAEFALSSINWVTLLKWTLNLALELLG